MLWHQQYIDTGKNLGLLCTPDLDVDLLIARPWKSANWRLNLYICYANIAQPLRHPHPTYVKLLRCLFFCKPYGLNDAQLLYGDLIRTALHSAMCSSKYELDMQPTFDGSSRLLLFLVYISHFSDLLVQHFIQYHSLNNNHVANISRRPQYENYESHQDSRRAPSGNSRCACPSDTRRLRSRES